MSDDGIRHTLTRADEVIGSRTGVPTTRPWFRCPYGDGEHDERVLAVISDLGYRNVGWDVDPCDWRPDRTTDEIVAAVVAGCREGAGDVRVLLHSWPDATLGALPLIIEDLRAAGRSRDDRRAAVSGAAPDILAVDGGNSKVDVALVRADGVVLGAARGGGTPFSPGSEGR